MRKLLVLLIWPYLVPPGLCVCCLLHIDEPLPAQLSTDGSAPLAPHDDEDHDDACPCARKLYILQNSAPIVAQPPLAAFLRCAAAAGPTVAEFPAPAGQLYPLRSPGPPVYLTLCALLC